MYRAYDILYYMYIRNKHKPVTIIHSHHRYNWHFSNVGMYPTKLLTQLAITEWQVGQCPNYLKIYEGFPRFLEIVKHVAKINSKPYIPHRYVIMTFSYINRV